jgi:hypothetical protein
MPVQIDESDPVIDSINVPSEARPGRAFTVEATIGNRQAITAPQDGTCQSGIFYTNVAWRNPVRIKVDGQTRHKAEVCTDGTAPNLLKTVTTQLQLSAGTHEVTAEVLKVPDMTVHDRSTRTVSVSEDASNPSTPSTGDQIMGYVEAVADALGGSVTMVAAGAILGIVVLGVI